MPLNCQHRLDVSRLSVRVCVTVLVYHHQPIYVHFSQFFSLWYAFVLFFFLAVVSFFSPLSSVSLCSCVSVHINIVFLHLRQVLFGTADGQVIVMDCHGRMLAHILLHESDGIVSMSWNYPSFLVEDSSESDTDSDDYPPPQGILLKTSSSTFWSRNMH